MFSIILSLCGCQKLKKILPAQFQKEEPAVKPLENLELAEAIVRPKPYAFNLTRDPFKPLVGASGVPLNLGPQTISAAAQVKVNGILLRESQRLALLEVLGKTEIYHEGDKILDYKIKKIEPKKVILEKAEGILVLEAEGEKWKK